MIAQLLTEWHGFSKRNLPWKQTKDPYKIWLSEVILQQTRVEQGLPYYEKFISLFPTVKHLAEADEAVVLKAWEGLGYYSRARNLHHSAKVIEEMGTFPETLEGWLALKGVGQYTARAVLSFAFSMPYAVLDGNVFRVISRVENDFTPIDASHARKHFQEIADTWLCDADSAIFNQAMMDLGATICTPQKPLCPVCPLNEICQAKIYQSIEKLPFKGKSIKIEKIFMDYYFVCNNSGQFIIRQRTDNGIWKKLWELPNDIILDFNTPPKYGKPITQIKHKLTHREMHLRLSVLNISEYELKPDEKLITWDETNHYAFPKGVMILLDNLLKSKSSSQNKLW